MNVLVIGANGSIARLVEQQLIQDQKFTDVHTTMFLRDKSRVNDLLSADNSSAVEGDLDDLKVLNQAMAGQNLIIDTTGATRNLEYTRHIISAMQFNQVQRVISINDLGIYDEVPGAFGAWNRSMVGSGLEVGRQASDLYENSGLSYTTLRLAWLNNENTIDYEITQKGEYFKGTTLSRKSVADVILKIVATPEYLMNTSVGLSKPGTDGDRPQL
ncbi:NAD(P)H-binding protein [Weissella minor]|uniref:NAD(P)H-binding protein n=1 Tax=Weissella minor TaxID=1620 RepID=UPI003AF286A5